MLQINREYIEQQLLEATRLKWFYQDNYPNTFWEIQGWQDAEKDIEYYENLLK